VAAAGPTPMSARCSAVSRRTQHDAHGFRRAGAPAPDVVPRRAGGSQSRGPRRQDHADQGPRGPVGGHTGAHVQELGERACAAADRPGGRPGHRPQGRPRPVRTRRGPAEQEDSARVESRPTRQPAPDAGERVQSPGGHSGRRREAGEHR